MDILILIATIFFAASLGIVSERYTSSVDEKKKDSLGISYLVYLFLTVSFLVWTVIRIT